MGKYDKDRFLKELATRYCLVRGLVPFLEVAVRSASDLSDSVELLTDLDVLGIEVVGDGSLRRTVFDCKTTNKMSSVNRAFWAAGVKEYTGCDDAYVILRSKAVHNHRISALSIDVDLHDERSFTDLGKTVDAGFPADECYQSSISRWNVIHECYVANNWADPLFDLVRNVAPVSKAPWSTFRRILAEWRNVRGQVDPAKDCHLTIFLDALASTFVLWATLGRDIRRFYEPTMNEKEFEKVLRYYLWGGKESYGIRQQMRDKTSSENGVMTPVELPAWGKLVAFAGVVVGAPQNILECAHASRELAIKVACGASPAFDKRLSARLSENARIRQFSIALSDYIVAAGGLPSDLATRVQRVMFEM